MSTARTEAEELAARLRAAGFLAYFAGGCVRDTLLGKIPKDYDIATNATPDQVSALFPGSRLVGAHFGVVLARCRSTHCEIATFRADGPYADGRHPTSVRFASPGEDALRRDFTINGLFEDPQDGTIHDFVGGLADLRNGVLRAIGDPAARFAEDHLRLLRAARFATVLDGFTLDPATWSAMQAAAPTIRSIAPERIRAELSLILAHPRRVQGFDLLVDSGLMREILPEILDLQGCEQPPEWHPEGDVFVHTRLMLGMLPQDAPESLVLAVLLHDIAKPATATRDPDGRIRFSGHDRVGAEMAEAILRRLRYPNAMIEDVCVMVRQHMNFMNVQAMRVAKLKRFMARPTFPLELELHRVDCTSSNGLLDNHEFLLEKSAEFASQPLIPERLVSGRDIMARGIEPGPQVGTILAEVQTLQLEGTLHTREDALAWLESRIAGHKHNRPPA